jgi:hypothetical protein
MRRASESAAEQSAEAFESEEDGGEQAVLGWKGDNPIELGLCL